MRYAWDSEKERLNRAKHGLGFDPVARLDWATVREIEDRRYDDGERRWRAIGTIDGRLHGLVYTLRGDTIRVISHRKANERECLLHARL